ncbi:MAG: preprotein translocase subunit SecG [Xanthomonadales bacterium]|nr:preprotein translocase subunit SecG [Xanthomonadales bacterium]
MLSLILNVVYVLIAIAMIALILLQQGKGAQAGSGFGSGASGTVFGARGAANFLSKTTRWLAIAFFGITLVMAWLFVHGSQKQVTTGSSIMATQPAAPATRTAPPAAAPQQGIPQATVPQAPAQNVPQAPANAPNGAPAGSQTH